MTIDINELRRLAQANYESNSVDSLYALQDVFDYKTILDLLDRLEAAEKELAELRSSMKFRTSLIGRTEAERNELRAKIAEMERQEPVGCVESLFDDFVIIHHNFDRAAPVYFAPGAQPAPSVPMDVIADYLVSISAHLAHRDDAKAQAEIGELLKMIASAPKPAPTIAEQDQINAEAAIRSIYGAQPAPSVPEGYKLTPINPDHQMLTAGNRWANGLAYETYVAMITAAPEVKP